MGVDHHLQKVNTDFMGRVIAVEQACFSDPWPSSAFLAELSHSWSHFKVLVRRRAPDDMQVDGYVIAWMLPDEMHLLKMAVLPDWHRRGLARVMLDDCLRTFSLLGGGVASLEVRPSNAPAVGLYSSFGFKQVAVRRAYYAKDNEDALLFMREVAQSQEACLESIGE